MNKSFDNAGQCVRKTKRAEVATNELSALDIMHLIEEAHMPFGIIYTDSPNHFNTPLRVSHTAPNKIGCHL